ncbi:TetR/AcrR family transcriptional regulator [Spelaeicoccus albus]|nr:TetR/AcrR family transcriptional regulator [Spelaeicoccus albus]
MSQNQPARPRSARLPRDVRRAQLLAAAQDVFARRGFHAASMEEIADVAGVSKPVLYQHFPGKRELYLAIVDANALALETAIEDALAATNDNKLRVLGAIDAYFSFVAQGDHAFRLIFGSDLRDDDVADRVEQLQSACAAAISDIIADDTGLDKPEALLLGRGLAGMAESAARYWLADPDPVPRAEAVELTARLAWRGISRFPMTGQAETAQTGGKQAG